MPGCKFIQDVHAPIVGSGCTKDYSVCDDTSECCDGSICDTQNDDSPQRLCLPNPYCDMSDDGNVTGCDSGCLSELDGGYYEMCGGACYNTSDSGCCDSTIYNVTESGCCNSTIYNVSESGCCGSGTPLYDIYDGNPSCSDCNGKFDFKPDEVWCCPETEEVYYSRDDCLQNNKHNGDLYCDSNIDPTNCTTGNNLYCPGQCRDDPGNCVEATVPGPNGCV